MRQGLNRESEGQKDGKNTEAEVLRTRFMLFSFSILCSWVDDFLLNNLRAFNVTCKPQLHHLSDWPIIRILAMPSHVPFAYFPQKREMTGERWKAYPF
jgi:hypothetical protein